MGLKDLHATLENNTYTGGYEGLNQTQLPNNSDGNILSQPFISRPIPPNPVFGNIIPGSGASLLDISNSAPGQFVDSLTDGFIRGGLVTATERSVLDTVRVGKFMFTPSGITFIAKQVALQASNPKLATGNNRFGELLGNNSLLGFDLGNRNRTYNLGLNTLAQVGLNAFGTHFDRAGITPRWPEDEKFANIEKLNANKVGLIKNRRFFGNEGKVESDYNRLLSLHSTIINQDYSQELSYGSVEDPNIFTKYLIDLGQETNPILYTYPGGPDSKYGIGETVIGRWVNSTINNKGEKLTIPNRIAGSHGFSSTGQGTHFQTPIKNYLRTLGRPGFNYSKRSEEGKSFHRETRIGLGNPGVGVSRTKDGRNDPYIRQTKKNGELNYNVYQAKRTDKVNMLDIFRSNTNQYQFEGSRDLIRFRFEAVDSDDPSKSDTMIFRAFLDDMSDSYKASHNNINYNGRAEDFYTYKSFNRDLNFSFKIAAQSRHEMMPLYRKLNYLVSNVAPEYENGRIRTPFMRLTIGGWIDRLPGVLTSINLSWQKDYPWEIAIDSPEGGMDSHMLVLPHVLDVSVSYQPIHNFLPQKSATKAPFIIRREDNGFLKEEQKWYKLGIAGKDNYDELMGGYIDSLGSSNPKFSTQTDRAAGLEAGSLGIEKLSNLTQASTFTTGSDGLPIDEGITLPLPYDFDSQIITPESEEVLGKDYSNMTKEELSEEGISYMDRDGTFIRNDS